MVTATGGRSSAVKDARESLKGGKEHPFLVSGGGELNWGSTGVGMIKVANAPQDFERDPGPRCSALWKDLISEGTESRAAVSYLARIELWSCF